MAWVRSFAPLARPDARVLILGSMPGIASLAAGQYYAHPRNLFWPILGELIGARAELPYAERVAVMAEAGIALWDVLQCCERDGSLDSAIAAHSVVVNDFAEFFTRHPRIARIYFNGQKADDSFRRHVRATLDMRRFECVRLPSTSPANAAMSPDRRLAAWRAVVSDAPLPQLSST